MPLGNKIDKILRKDWEQMVYKILRDDKDIFDTHFNAINNEVFKGKLGVFSEEERGSCILRAGTRARNRSLGNMQIAFSTIIIQLTVSIIAIFAIIFSNNIPCWGILIIILLFLMAAGVSRYLVISVATVFAPHLDQEIIIEIFDAIEKGKI